MASHVYTTGPAQDFLEFLIENRCQTVLFVGHPLFYDKNIKGSGFELYSNGAKILERYGENKKSGILAYLKHFILTVIWSFRIGIRWDLFVGANNLNAFAGIMLRRLFRVKKAVYYVIDYNPYRFKNRLMNRIYHWIDQYCVRNADQTWNLSPRMESARKEYFGFSGGNQNVVPIGIWFDRIKRRDIPEIARHTLVFMGHILEKQGIQYVLSAIPDIIREIPDFKFLVLGGGEYLSTLKAQGEALRIMDHIEFTGYVERHEDIEDILSHCGVAVALYEQFDSDGHLSFTYFSDPGKVKVYLACGLPVLISDVAHIARDIETSQCGIVIDVDPRTIAKATISLMKDEATLRKYRENAVKYAAQFDWNKILSDRLSLILGGTDI